MNSLASPVSGNAISGEVDRKRVLYELIGESIGLIRFVKHLEGELPA